MVDCRMPSPILLRLAFVYHIFMSVFFIFIYSHKVNFIHLFIHLYSAIVLKMQITVKKIIISYIDSIKNCKKIIMVEGILQENSWKSFEAKHLLCR